MDMRSYPKNIYRRRQTVCSIIITIISIIYHLSSSPSSLSSSQSSIIYHHHHHHHYHHHHHHLSLSLSINSCSTYVMYITKQKNSQKRCLNVNCLLDMSVFMTQLFTQPLKIIFITVTLNNFNLTLLCQLK